MCGHVGVAGTMIQKHEQAFKDLLVVDVIRGPHGTGIASFNRKDGIRVMKKALLPNDLFSMDGTKELFRTFNQVLLGHNRWATQGKINHVNSHPFEMGNLVGAHNGTLVNQGLLPDSEDFEVDSENLIHSLNKIGVAETYKLLHGAAALVWFNDKDYTVNFLRNDQRPMFITYSEDRKTMFWASESWMLRGVLAKNGIEHTEVFNTAVDTHYKIRIPQWDDPMREGEKTKTLTFDKMEAKVLAPYVPPKKSIPPSHKGGAGTVVNINAHKGITTTSTGRTVAGGVADYEIGEEVYFFLDPECDRTKRWIDYVDSQRYNKIVRVYCHKESWLRKRLDDEGDFTTLYSGTCNGYMFGDIGNGVLCQGNSVEEIDPEDVEWTDENKDGNVAQGHLDLEDDIPFSLEEFSLGDREHQKKVLIRANNTCGICSDHDVQPNPRNFCLTDADIICYACRDTSFAKELIDAY